MAPTPDTNRPADRPTTLGALRASGYRPRSVKDEIRHNLRRKLRSREPLFPGILGYDRTVIPGVVNALLAGHDLILLGLRGQAKTRILRALTDLLDPEIPVLAGTELNDDPLAPISTQGERMKGLRVRPARHSGRPAPARTMPWPNCHPPRRETHRVASNPFV
jgi:magnesium chelatase subunit I